MASADDTPGLFTDGYLTAVLPEDGEYVLEFCDSRFAGTGRAVYRLLIGAVPFAGEVYPLSLPRGQNTALELRGGTLSDDRLFALRTPSDPVLSMFYPSIPARLLGDPAWADSDLDVELPTPVLLGTADRRPGAGRSCAEAPPLVAAGDDPGPALEARRAGRVHDHGPAGEQARGPGRGLGVGLRAGRSVARLR